MRQFAFRNPEPRPETGESTKSPSNAVELGDTAVGTLPAFKMDTNKPVNPTTDSRKQKQNILSGKPGRAVLKSVDNQRCLKTGSEQFEETKKTNL